MIAVRARRYTFCFCQKQRAAICSARPFVALKARTPRPGIFARASLYISYIAARIIPPYICVPSARRCVAD